MAEIEDQVRKALIALEADFSEMACDPDLADTEAFCAAYGIAPEDSANCILVASRKPEGHLALCLVLAPNRLDVNNTVRRLMGVRKLSFAPPEVTKEATGMLIGGVTPFGVAETIPVYVDARVMERKRVIVGGGSRSLKINVDPEVFTRMPNAEIVEGLAT